MAVKLIAVDMDGTFLNPQHEYNKIRFREQYQHFQRLFVNLPKHILQQPLIKHQPLNLLKLLKQLVHEIHLLLQLQLQYLKLIKFRR